MDHALFITNLKNLKFFDKKYSRIYFGNEFCERLIPDKADLNKVVDFCKKNNVLISFVTPYATDKGINAISELIDLLKEEKIIDEIIFNDWGVFNKFKGILKSKRWVKGRVLTKQYKDTRFIELKKIIPKNILPWFQSSTVDTEISQDFLINKNVFRIELDNLFQGINMKLSRSDIKASLYYPYNFITTTRICQSARCTSKKKKKVTIEDGCSFECRTYTFDLKAKDMPKSMKLKGNTCFYYLDRLPKEMIEKGIDRLVFMPEIPM
jgi:hypothetical protein